MDSHNFTQLISGLVLDNAQQQRTSTITIGSFDIAISIIMLGSILWDTYSTEDDSSDADSCASPKWFRLVHPAEVFPFVVSVVTLFQGGVFVGVQSSALQSYIETQCRMTAEVLWPTIWLFPLTVSVFGLETSFRSLGKDRFRARGRWSTLICVGAIAILTFALWLYSYLVATGDECVGALIIYSADYATVAIALASALILFHLLIGSVVTFQLLRTVTMDNIERIMATRVVCTQYISVLILACVLPYYIQAIGHDRSSSQISQMADIVVNLAGILNALLHLFLRTNSYRIAIRSAKVPWSEKRALRLFGPNDLNLGKVISSPLLLDPRDDPSMGANRYGTQKQDVDEVRNSRAKSLPRLSMIGRSPSLRHTKSGPIKMPLMTQTTPLSSPRSPQHQIAELRSLYSVFPVQGLGLQGPEGAIGTVKEDEAIEFPAPLFASRHPPENSDQGSAIVQIGLRLNHTSEDRKTAGMLSHQASTPSNTSLPRRPLPTSSRTSLPRRQLSTSSKDRRSLHRTSNLRLQPSDESLIIPPLLKEPPPPMPRTPSSHRRSKYSTQSKYSQRTTTKSLPPIPVLPSSRVASSLYEDPPSAKPLTARDHNIAP